MGGPWLPRLLGSGSPHRPADAESALSAGAREVLDRAFADVGPGGLVDHHAHVVGLGRDGTGCFVHPHKLSWRHPLQRTTMAVFAGAAAVRDLGVADQEYMVRLTDLAAHVPSPSRLRLLAFDRHYRPDGTADEGRTELFVPNDYVFELAAARPDLFSPTVSVHPYRPDALDELARCHERGARHVKWLPNAMGMDPADPRCDPFYERLQELDMALLSHVGWERSVRAREHQRLGNPLRLRRALDHGVRVVLAHCASRGRDEDLDRPARRPVESFDLFLRIMEEPRYEGLAFGEISAVTVCDRLPRPLATLLAREDLHHRLVNGSDYPIPAIGVALRTRDLVRHGFLTRAEREALNEVSAFNPLLFDYAVKRTLKHPDSGVRFPPDVFGPHPGLPD